MKSNLDRINDRILQIKDRCGWKEQADIPFVLTELMNLCDEIRNAISLMVVNNIKDDDNSINYGYVINRHLPGEGVIKLKDHYFAGLPE